MGQIRRGKAAMSSSPVTNHKLFKFRRMLSWRSSTSPRANARVGDDRSSVPGLNMADLDPPLPVVRRADRGGNSVSLWRRRCGGQALEGLKLQQQKHSILFTEEKDPIYA